MTFLFSSPAFQLYKPEKWQKEIRKVVTKEEAMNRENPVVLLSEIRSEKYRNE